MLSSRKAAQSRKVAGLGLPDEEQGNRNISDLAYDGKLTLKDFLLALLCNAYLLLTAGGLFLIAKLLGFSLQAS